MKLSELRLSSALVPRSQQGALPRGSRMFQSVEALFAFCARRWAPGAANAAWAILGEAARRHYWHSTAVAQRYTRFT